MIELINAADYLDISPLLDIACAKAATMVKDYDNEKFIEIFQIEQDLTDEELKQQEAEFQKEKEIKMQNKRELELEIEPIKKYENKSDL